MLNYLDNILSNMCMTYMIKLLLNYELFLSFLEVICLKLIKGILLKVFCLD